ncbi:hypothetical protein N7485_009945 [Penicillium canescens]|nr:hypothetical protein N7485_009945 [Penicillium canescens]
MSYRDEGGGGMTGDSNHRNEASPAAIYRKGNPAEILELTAVTVAVRVSVTVAITITSQGKGCTS